MLNNYNLENLLDRIDKNEEAIQNVCARVIQLDQ